MKILVYDDSPDFGGHQIMAYHGIEELAADPDMDVVFMFNPANRQRIEKLPLSGTIQTLKTPCSDRTLQALNPDLVLCIQGDIEHSSQGIHAARRAGIECVSYIAIPHRLATMGAKLGTLRDRINRPLFNQPDRFITLSKTMKALLLERGVKKPITIVPNGIPIPPGKPLTPHASRPTTLGLLGRIEFKQKQQDFMVRTFHKYPDVFTHCRLLIAGNGPDERKLKKQVAGQENIIVMPWQDDCESFYQQIDFLVIPSRFEGVPLVMLEALARGIPVLGSARDGMKELLPEAWIFEPEHDQALADAFFRIQKIWRDDIATLQATVLNEYSLERFKTNFQKAVTGT